MKKYILFIVLAFSSTNTFCMKTSKSEGNIQETAKAMDSNTNTILLVDSSKITYKYAKRLCKAALKNNVQAAKEFLDAGLSPNLIPFYPGAEGCHQYAPIHLAALCDNVEMLKLLISAKALLNAVCVSVSDGRHTALCLAVSKNNIRSVKILVEAGADVNAGLPDYKPILIATIMGHIDILKYLVELRNSSGLPLVDLNTVDNKGYAALHYAAQNGNLEAVKILVEAGVDPMTLTTDGATSLNIAARNDHVEIVSYLINLTVMCYS